jgi:hypothetical protein
MKDEIDLFMLPRERRITLQIPDLIIDQNICKKADLSKYPKEWFCYLKDDALVAGKEQGFLFWSKKGWEANKEKIKEEFNNSTIIRNPHLNWSDFEKHANKHFKMVEDKTKKKMKRMLKKADQLKKELNDLEEFLK